MTTHDYKLYSAVCEFRSNATKETFTTLYDFFHQMVTLIQRVCTIFQRWNTNSLIGYLFSCINRCKPAAGGYFGRKLLLHCRRLHKLEAA